METAIVSRPGILSAIREWLETQSPAGSRLMEEPVTHRQMLHLCLAAACLAVPFLSSSPTAIALSLAAAAAMMKTYHRNYEEKGGEA